MHNNDELEDRRKFLASCGKFAAVTPPLITAMLSTSLVSTAVMASGGHVGHVNPDHPDHPAWGYEGGRSAYEAGLATAVTPPTTTTVDLSAAPMTVGSPDMGTPSL